MFKKIKSLLLVTLVVGGTVVGCNKQTDNVEDKTKVTFLIDRNQKDVLPNYLIDAYRREKYPEQ